MKKISAFMIALTAAAGLLTGCQPKQNETKHKEISNVKVTQQDSESYENAIKECFEAMYSSGGAEVFYSYMYPEAALNAMKESGLYDERLKMFNENQEKQLSLKDNKYKFSEVKEADELREEQVSRVKNYFIELSQPFTTTLTEEQLVINIGYEVVFSYSNNGEEAGEETVIVVNLNDEGWKIITR